MTATLTDLTTVPLPLQRGTLTPPPPAVLCTCQPSARWGRIVDAGCPRHGLDGDPAHWRTPTRLRDEPGHDQHTIHQQRLEHLDRYADPYR